MDTTTLINLDTTTAPQHRPWEWAAVRRVIVRKAPGHVHLKLPKGDTRNLIGARGAQQFGGWQVLVRYARSRATTEGARYAPGAWGLYLQGHYDEHADAVTAAEALAASIASPSWQAREPAAVAADPVAWGQPSFPSVLMARFTEALEAALRPSTGAAEWVLAADN